MSNAFVPHLYHTNTKNTITHTAQSAYPTVENPPAIPVCFSAGQAERPFLTSPCSSFTINSEPTCSGGISRDLYLGSWADCRQKDRSYGIRIMSHGVSPFLMANHGEYSKKRAGE